MKIVITGSIAFDYLMSFPGKFRDHILAEQLDRISLSFLVDSLEKRPGGIAANIAYTLALLGEHPTIMATVGSDFAAQCDWLQSKGVDISGIRVIEEAFTASFFVTTDRINAQIASFHTGAMARSAELRFSDLQERPALALISPNDPQAMLGYGRECLALGIPYIYDPSQQIVRMDNPALDEGIAGCSALFGNDYEFALLKERLGVEPFSLAAQGKLVVVTLGERGADIYHGSDRLHVEPVAPDQIADPTGVGDAFRGGFLRGYLKDFDLERCGQMGAVAASYCLEQKGTMTHAFSLPQFIARFRQHFDDHGELDTLL